MTAMVILNKYEQIMGKDFGLCIFQCAMSTRKMEFKFHQHKHNI